MHIDNFYSVAYDWLLSFGPRSLVGIIALFVGCGLRSKAYNRRKISPPKFALLPISFNS